MNRKWKNESGSEDYTTRLEAEAELSDYATCMLENKGIDTFVNEQTGQRYKVYARVLLKRI